jgi:hypothetical protein
MPGGALATGPGKTRGPVSAYGSLVGQPVIRVGQQVTCGCRRIPGAVSTAQASSFLNAAGTIGRVTINERIEAGRRERRVLARVSRAAWRLEQAERERTWALVSARAEGISIRTLAAPAGLSPSRVHQIVAGAGLDALDAAIGEPRAAGWPAPRIQTCRPGRPAM